MGPQAWKQLPGSWAWLSYWINLIMAWGLSTVWSLPFSPAWFSASSHHCSGWRSLDTPPWWPHAFVSLTSAQGMGPAWNIPPSPLSRSILPSGWSWALLPPKNPRARPTLNLTSESGSIWLQTPFNKSPEMLVKIIQFCSSLNMMCKLRCLGGD